LWSIDRSDQASTSKRMPWASGRSLVKFTVAVWRRM
jgi:hypothetical protein